MVPAKKNEDVLVGSSLVFVEKLHEVTRRPADARHVWGAAMW